MLVFPKKKVVRIFDKLTANSLLGQRQHGLRFPSDLLIVGGLMLRLFGSMASKSCATKRKLKKERTCQVKRLPKIDAFFKKESEFLCL